ncbi:NUDIX domain-containing protein [Halostagnicola kamekurae]|uniref:NUDIX domain-containing protein n=1 Tax=Halostagnicola kamekurae TaxID=619731 RepID=UPI000B884AA4
MACREAVSGVVYKNDQFLLVHNRGWDESVLCFPQGGIKAGESDREALERELVEELVPGHSRSWIARTTSTTTSSRREIARDTANSVSRSGSSNLSARRTT